MDEKINPSRPYKEGNIDRFYWEAEDGDKYYVPLLKPLRLIKWKGNDEWILDTSVIGWKYGDMGPITFIYAKDIYVYGLQDITHDDQNRTISHSFFFIINIENNDIKTYDYDKQRNEFEQNIKKLKLPEIYLEPQNIYWQFEKYPDLEWYPEDIKKKIEAL